MFANLFPLRPNDNKIIYHTIKFKESWIYSKLTFFIVDGKWSMFGLKKNCRRKRLFLSIDKNYQAIKKDK